MDLYNRFDQPNFLYFRFKRKYFFFFGEGRIFFFLEGGLEDPTISILVLPGSKGGDNGSNIQF